MNTTTSTQQTKWTLDGAHTTVGFSVRHLMITNVRGEFQKVSGSATYDRANPEASHLEATIEVGSVSTREAQRDTHLKSADFFDAEKFPTITFKSKRTNSLGKDKLELTGDLTIHGTTREATLLVTDITAEQKDPWGNQRIGASAVTKIKRSDFGMTWNSPLDTGGFVLGDEINVTLDVSLIKSK
jgi:polyisoprenoid-binding protein YceI